MRLTEEFIYSFLYVIITRQNVVVVLSSYKIETKVETKSVHQQQNDERKIAAKM